MTALDAARDGDWTACLSALLELWREHRAAELCPLIDRASERARGLEVAPKMIAKRIAAATDVDVGPIVAVIRRQLRTQPSFFTHAIELAKARPPDPRIATLLAELFARAAYSHGHGPLDRRVLDQLAAIDDPRYRMLIAREAEGYRVRRGRFPRRYAAIDHLIAVAAKLSARPAPSAFTIEPELQQLFDREPVDADIDALYAAVYANPSELDARIVLADALIEHGDPRGEFIALQCGRAIDAPPTRRERELLAANGRAWLGAAEKFVRKEGVVYRRGFVACARLTEVARRTPDRVWHTIEELDVGGWWTDASLPEWLPTLPALHRVWGVSTYRWEPVIAVPHPWTTLGLYGVRTNTFQELDAARGNFTQLVELDLSSTNANAAVLAHLAETQIAAQLQRVRVSTRISQLAQVNALAALPLAIDVVPSYSFPPLEDGPIARLAQRRLALIARTPKDVRYLLALLRALELGSITHASITAPPKADTRALVAELQRLQVTS